MTDIDAVSELVDAADDCHVSLHGSIDDDEGNELLRSLIVSHVPDAVFEHQQAQVMNTPCRHI